MADTITVRFTGVYDTIADEPLSDQIGEGATVDEAWTDVIQRLRAVRGGEATALTYDDWTAA